MNTTELLILLKGRYVSPKEVEQFEKETFTKTTKTKHREKKNSNT